MTARAANGPIVLTLARRPSPVGPLLIVCANDALCALDYDDYDHRLHALLRQRFGDYRVEAARDPLRVGARLDDYFAGDLDALESIAISGGGTPYQQRVWAALRAIPAGTTCSYGQLAVAVGNTHARAVGQANALNPIAIVVPCHRVIGADRRLTGYAGGMARKRWLLDHEARFAGRAPAFAFACAAGVDHGN